MVQVLIKYHCFNHTIYLKVALKNLFVLKVIALAGVKNMKEKIN